MLGRFTAGAFSFEDALMAIREGVLRFILLTETLSEGEENYYYYSPIRIPKKCSCRFMDEL